MAMGYAHGKAKRALQRCNGDLQAAAERLVRGAEDNAMSESSSSSSASDSDSDSTTASDKGSSGSARQKKKEQEEEMMRVLMPDVSGDLFEHLDTNLEEEAELLQKYASMLP